MKLNQYFTIYLLCTLNSGIKVSPMFINFNFFTYPMPFLKALRLLNLVSKIRKKKTYFFFHYKNLKILPKFSMPYVCSRPYIYSFFQALYFFCPRSIPESRVQKQNPFLAMRDSKSFLDKNKASASHLDYRYQVHTM